MIIPLLTFSCPAVRETQLIPTDLSSLLNDTSIEQLGKLVSK
jgi:hypothetical protein